MSFHILITAFRGRRLASTLQMGKEIFLFKSGLTPKPGMNPPMTDGSHVARVLARLFQTPCRRHCLELVSLPCWSLVTESQPTWAASLIPDVTPPLPP